MKWLANENFDNDILRGVLRRSPGMDIIRVQDISAIYGKGDPAMLEWATADGRILPTHDLSTMVPAMRWQLERAALCTPIVLVPDSLPIAWVIEEILLLDECSRIRSPAADWKAASPVPGTAAGKHRRPLTTDVTVVVVTAVSVARITSTLWRPRRSPGGSGGRRHNRNRRRSIGR